MPGKINKYISPGTEGVDTEESPEALMGSQPSLICDPNFLGKDPLSKDKVISDSHMNFTCAHVLNNEHTLLY